jgi:hypothetical protein
VFAIALLALAVFLLWLAVFSVASIWGYEGEGIQWGYGIVATLQAALALWLIYAAVRIIRRRF